MVDDDGWTHVTSDQDVQRIADLDDDLLREMTESMKDRIEKAPSDLNLEKLRTQYQRCKTRFTESSCWRSLSEQVQQHALHEDQIIDNCVCLGLSSPSAPRYHLDRRDVAMYQLAAFKALVELIQQHQPDTPLRAFAQDPIFNALDIELLADLSITVVEHPEGFIILGPRSFVYAPGHEQAVLKAILQRDPALFFAHDLDIYQDNQNRWRCTTFRTLSQSGSDAGLPLEETFNQYFGITKSNKLGIDAALDSNVTQKGSRLETSIMENTQIIEDLDGANLVAQYLKDKGSIAMSKFEGHDHAFFDNCVRYRLPKEKEEDE